jgi:hypothetical protein
MNDYRLSAIRKIGSDKVKSRSRDAIEGRQAVKKDVVVDSIESSREVKQD